MSLQHKEQAGVFRISKEGSSSGMTNAAYTASMSELPNRVFQDFQANTLGLDVSDPEEELEGGDHSLEVVMCREHKRRASWFCVDCSMNICARCHKIHHFSHSNINRESMTGSAAIVTDAYTKYTEQAETYQKSLLKELGSLDDTLSGALIDVEKAYEVILSRVAEKKSESVTKVKAVISSQKELLNQRLNNNQKVIDDYQKVLQADIILPMLEDNTLSHLPSSLVVPTTSLTTDVSIKDLIIPELKIEMSSAASTLPVNKSNSLRELKLTHISSIGTKGSENLQFKLPGGICVDRDNNVYVADEGNNRIQKISKDGHCLGTFAWGKGQSVITDVAYNPSSDQLLVPRAYNEKGLLKCSEFSHVTLEGVEIGRFVVPGMHGGLFISCADDGDILISDVVKKSVFFIRDGHVHREITNSQFLKQPAFTTFGRDGEVLVVDSGRKVVAVFDHNGLHLRDITVPVQGNVTLKKPSGVAIDRSCGVVAVTDWCGDKLILFSYDDGKVLATTSGFKCPHSVAINDSHRVIVTDCWNNQLKVFSYTSEMEE